MRKLCLAVLLLLAACGGTIMPTPEPTLFQSVLMLPAIANNAPSMNRLRGLGIDTGWNDDVPIETFNCGDAEKVGAGWWHNWRVTNLDCPLEGFIPTAYNANTLNVQPLATTGGPIFGFNEPDSPDQANIWPAELAAQLTAKMMDDCPAHDWIGASISTYHMDYYAAYLAELDRLGVAGDLYGLSLNCYQSSALCQAAITQVRAWADERGIPTVWLKEFKLSNLDEARAFIDWLEANDVHYAWFLSRVGPRVVGGGWFYDSPLFDTDGEMTIYGEMYKETRHEDF